MKTENWNWFALNFEWFGLGIAIIVWILLFTTDKLRSNLNISKWKDFTWLSWLGMTIYLVHNVEEYGIDLFGNRNSFPNQIYTMLGQIAPNATGPATSYFLAVNITAFWVMSPICALLSRKRPFTGLAVYSIILINTFFHLMPSIVGGAYNPGLVSTILFFIPILIWLFSKCLKNGKYKRQAIFFLGLGGIMYHIILTVPMFIALKVNIADSIIALSQILNAGILLAFFLWADKKLKLLNE